MRIAIVGAGGVGGYFGARLALAGQDVAVVARGLHLAAIRRGGLQVKSPALGAFVAQVTAEDDPRSIGVVDLVVFAVKTYWAGEGRFRRASRPLPPSCVRPTSRSPPCPMPACPSGTRLADLEQGRRIEVEALQGEAIRRARSHGVPTPVLSTLYGLLAPWSDGPPASG